MNQASECCEKQLHLRKSCYKNHGPVLFSSEGTAAGGIGGCWRPSGCQASARPLYREQARKCCSDLEGEFLMTKSQFSQVLISYIYHCNVFSLHIAVCFFLNIISFYLKSFRLIKVNRIQFCDIKNLLWINGWKQVVLNGPPLQTRNTSIRLYFIKRM